MSEIIARLESELKRERAKEKAALERCQYCDGQGSFLDTTYDRSGTETQCDRCYGTGLPQSRVRQIIADAFAPYRRTGAMTAQPSPATSGGRETDSKEGVE